MMKKINNNMVECENGYFYVNDMEFDTLSEALEYADNCKRCDTVINNMNCHEVRWFDCYGDPCKNIADAKYCYCNDNIQVQLFIDYTDIATDCFRLGHQTEKNAFINRGLFVYNEHFDAWEYADDAIATMIYRLINN